MRKQPLFRWIRQSGVSNVADPTRWVKWTLRIGRRVFVEWVLMFGEPVVEVFAFSRRRLFASSMVNRLAWKALAWVGEAKESAHEKRDWIAPELRALMDEDEIRRARRQP